MSSLFRAQPDHSWESVPLESLNLGCPDVRLVRFGSGAEAGVALLAKPTARIRVNGLTIAGGLHVLNHRDELLVGRDRYCYSADATPVVTVFQLREGQRRPTCPVCRGQLKDGDQAVSCPRCERWFHQLDRKTCWTYKPTCLCQHPTALNGATAWHPAQEEDAHV